MTLVAVFALVIYLGMNLHTAISLGEYKTTDARRIRNLYLEKNIIDLTSKNFDFAVQLAYSG